MRAGTWTAKPARVASDHLPLVAELAAALPEAGGEYVYLREAYGPLWSFIYGWTQMWVAKSGSVATLATAFFLYLANFFPKLEGVFFVIPLPLGAQGAPAFRYSHVGFFAFGPIGREGRE